MKKSVRLLSVLICLLLTVGTASADVVVSDADYEIFEKFMKLAKIEWILDNSYLWEYDEDALLEGAVNGMLGALDDVYTFYYDAAGVQGIEEDVQGTYGGLGFEVFSNYTDNTLTIRRVFFGAPAQQAGIKPEDKIFAVNGVEMTAADISEAVSMMRGVPGEEVTLTIRRGEEFFDVTCIRAIVENETISYHMIDESIGYVRIYYFEGNLDKQFSAAIEELRKQGMQALVIDLRDNTGGFTNLAEAVADEFLQRDDVIYSSEDKYGRKVSRYAKGKGYDIPIAVLINEFTASASEIVTCALTENDLAFTVGVKSFGKGIMQEVYMLDETSAMQLTSHYWLTPTGNCIHGEGIAPDYPVELNEDAIDEMYDYIPEKDNQLQTAVEQLRNMLAEKAA